MNLGAAAAAVGSVGKALSYQDLQNKYLDFNHPRAVVYLGDKMFSNTGDDMLLNDIHVELTSGFEASVASFRIYDVYNTKTGKFRFDDMKKQVMMGNSVTITMGYLDKFETVFVGFVSGVAFGYELESLPYIEVTAMDVKGVMMGGNYANQLKATTYSAAVKEILNRTGEGKLKQLGGITDIAVSNTPDAELSLGGGVKKSSPITVELVNESDYEFVVRAAKRYNFEFFVDRGKVLFRPAKQDTSVLMEIGAGRGLQTFHIQYSITGVVGKIEARAMDPGKGEAISASSRFNNTISTANKAKQLVGRGTRVYVDASISSKEEAESRVAALMEQMSYRLGSLEARCVGIPDMVPGRFIKVSGMGAPVDNQFYLTSVTHDFTSETGFSTQIQGCAAKIQASDLPI